MTSAAPAARCAGRSQAHASWTPLGPDTRAVANTAHDGRRTPGGRLTFPEYPARAARNGELT